MILEGLKRNWFLLGILAVIVLGLAFPDASSRLNPDSLTTTWIVVVLFLITGLTLPSETIWRDMSDYRLHLFIQLYIFLFTPAYFWLSSRLLGPLLPSYLRIGVLALGCLPTTVSSCIVFTQLAQGNVVAAIFNSTLANTAGIVLSPLLISFLLQSDAVSLPAGEALRLFRSLGLTIFLPFLAGQGARILFAKRFVDGRRAALAVISNGLILGIIFFAIASSARHELLRAKAYRLLLPFAYLAFSHILLIFLSYWGARRFGFDGPGLITVVFVATQKTAAMGIPLLSVYFASDRQTLAAAILPLIFYHAWQLLVAGLLKNSQVLRRIKERR